MDALTVALNELRMHSALFCRAELSAPWGFSSRYEKGASFYVILEGRCWLEVDGAESRWLSRGDFIVLPHSHPHTLRDVPGTPTRDLQTLMDRASPGLNTVVRLGSGTVTTQILGGCFWFEEAKQSPLLRALPPLLYVVSEQGQSPDWLQTTIGLVSQEASAEQLGAHSVINYLASVLFIQAVRVYLTQLSAPGNWLGALVDPQIGEALALIHQQTERPWTVETLAARVAMSRSAFAARFAMYVGEPPLRYLTRRRMHQAGRLLKTSTMTLAQIAERVGYHSEVAFSRAFKQWMAIAPGQYRHSNSV